MYRCLPILSLLLLLLSCSPVYVSYHQQAENRSLSQYQTFNFAQLNVDNQSSWQPQAQNLDRVKALVTQEMEERGLRKVDGNADLLVNLGVVISDEVQTRETDIRDAPIYVGTRNYHWESEEVVVREYQQGTLMMDVIDAANQEMIWQGVAKSTMTSNREKMAKRVEQAVAQLFKSFPG